MNTRKKLLLLCITLSLLATGGYIASTNLEQKPFAPQPNYTIISHNVASIQVNPLEYTSTLASLINDQEGSDDALKKAAKRLLEIDTNPATYRCRHTTIDLEKALYYALKAYYHWTQHHYKPKKIKAEVRKFLLDQLNNNTKQQPEFNFNQALITYFDKRISTLGLQRFSPLYYNEKFIYWLSKNKKTLDIENFTSIWITTMASFIKIMATEIGNDPLMEKKLRLSYLSSLLFDLHSLKRLFDHNGIEAWLTLTKKLQTSPLSNKEKKNKALTQLYKKENPTILCLQECDASLINTLHKAGYFSIEKSNPNNNTNHVHSTILYKKEIFAPENITVLHLDKEELKPYYNSTIQKAHLARLTGSEVVIHQVRHDNMIWLVSSFHASSNGDNTLVFLRLLFALQERIEAKSGLKVLLILGTDANTSQQAHLIQARLKQDLKKVDALISKYPARYTRIPTSNASNTVQKKRSTFQMQLSKIHVNLSSISDFILLSNSVSQENTHTLYIPIIKKALLGPHGPQPTSNPSDHAPIMLTFMLNKEKKDNKAKKKDRK